MKKRDNAILLGIGTTRRKFVVTDSNPAGLRMKIPAMRYHAKKSGKLCRGYGNHKCLFNKGDTLNVLCPETVMEDGLATVLIHREWNGKDMLMQRNFNDYSSLLEFKEECVLEFPVVQVGHLSYGNCDEFLCIQPAPETNLWVDKKLTLSCEVASTGGAGAGTKAHGSEESGACEGAAQEACLGDDAGSYYGIGDFEDYSGYGNYDDFLPDPFSGSELF